jgi:hypothetical protein
LGKPPIATEHVIDALVLARRQTPTAIAIAQRQKARSFELHAALSMAKLYQSNGRPADAHAVLAPALEPVQAVGYPRDWGKSRSAR